MGAEGPSQRSGKDTGHKMGGTADPNSIVERVRLDTILRGYG